MILLYTDLRILMHKLVFIYKEYHFVKMAFILILFKTS